MSQTYEGGCSCGEVRFRMESDPLIVHCCHCHWCQRESGSAFALNAMIESTRVSILKGDPKSFPAPSNSGAGQDFWRCPNCMITVWSTYGGFGDVIRCVRVGALDEAHGIEPDIHIYTASKQAWFEIPEGKPSVEAYYRKKAVWSESSLLRMRELLDAAN